MNLDSIKAKLTNEEAQAVAKWQAASSVAKRWFCTLGGFLAGVVAHALVTGHWL